MLIRFIWIWRLAENENRVDAPTDAGRKYDYFGQSDRWNNAARSSGPKEQVNIPNHRQFIDIIPLDGALHEIELFLLEFRSRSCLRAAASPHRRTKWNIAWAALSRNSKR